MRTNQKNRLVTDVRRGKTTPPPQIQLEFLTEAQLETIRNCELPTSTLDHTRHIFLFQCVTGLRYEELLRITANNILADPKTGMQYIAINRKKTGIQSIIPLTCEASRIIDFFRNHPSGGKDRLLIPVVKFERYNYALKQLANIAGLKKRLTTSCARRTATTYFFSKGLSTESLSAMLGYTVRVQSLCTTPLPERVINDFLKNKIAVRKAE